MEEQLKSLEWKGISFGESRLKIIETDASRKGWRAFCMGTSTGGQWSQAETSLHINCLELLAGALKLEQSEGICLPSFCSGRQMPQTTDRPEGAISGTVSTSMAVPAVVSITELYCSTSSVTSLSRPVNLPDRNAPTRQSPTCRLAAISQPYVKASISQPAQELLLAAWRKGTTTTYASAWRKCDSWCCGRQINSVHAPVEAILEFLISEFNSGKAYRTLNVYRSAISSTHAHIDFVRVGEHPHIKPNKPISSATLGRWLKKIISKDGIDKGIFKAHSVRGAAATSSFNMGIPLQDILKLADWSTDSTFRRFYYKPTNQPFVARSLISGRHDST